jgi:hypothetical protein
MTRRGAARRGAARGALALALAGAAACGGGARPASAQPAAEVATSAQPDARTPFQRRRDAACDQLAPRLVACAVADSQAQRAAGAITQAQLEEATRPEVRAALAADWRKRCRDGELSSRQVRVLEVCDREETACEPLLACLRHLDARAP